MTSIGSNAGEPTKPPASPGTADPPWDQRDLSLSNYAFELPERCIAQRPLEPRHAARMLAVAAAPAPGSAAIASARHLTVWDLQQELRSGDLLVVNNTRVLRARLRTRRSSGGAVELLVLEPAGLATPLASPTPLGAADWLCLARPAKRLQPGEVLQLDHGDLPPLPLPP
jgi:S-adenosylmethionine:tRNA ribosyltransferase-isomerase